MCLQQTLEGNVRLIICETTKCNSSKQTQRLQITDQHTDMPFISLNPNMNSVLNSPLRTYPDKTEMAGSKQCSSS
jgi:hypothetical protein